jgi:hypothetical protein
MSFKKNFNLLNHILGWVVTAVALVVYGLTMEDTVSFWDCGEFIASAHKLQVGHPPGAPLFALLGRLFIILGRQSLDRCRNGKLVVCSGQCPYYRFFVLDHYRFGSKNL